MLGGHYDASVFTLFSLVGPAISKKRSLNGYYGGAC